MLLEASPSAGSAAAVLLYMNKPNGLIANYTNRTKTILLFDSAFYLTNRIDYDTMYM